MKTASCICVESFPRILLFLATLHSGTGLVTSGGETWRKMRGSIGKALRVEILDEIIGIATRATERLCSKLDIIKGTGVSIDLENEFRLLTLQVIGEAILSLSPEESDELFPSLYLPIMDECNARSLSPWRTYVPSPDWFAHRWRVREGSIPLPLSLTRRSRRSHRRVLSVPKLFFPTRLKRTRPDSKQNKLERHTAVSCLGFS